MARSTGLDAPSTAALEAASLSAVFRDLELDLATGILGCPRVLVRQTPPSRTPNGSHRNSLRLGDIGPEVTREALLQSVLAPISAMLSRLTRAYARR